MPQLRNLYDILKARSKQLMKMYDNPNWMVADIESLLKIVKCTLEHTSSATSTSME